MVPSDALVRAVGVEGVGSGANFCWLKRARPDGVRIRREPSLGVARAVMVDEGKPSAVE